MTEDRFVRSSSFAHSSRYRCRYTEKSLTALLRKKKPSDRYHTLKYLYVQLNSDFENVIKQNQKDLLNLK
ncbi:hypothetical protein O3M35_004814 [Rhynocoris fuscipes]|uniref:Uncharacterized protein n=1 Tax=Rhynocoris fuscipes TaxID=488301 RepID=A0AAW1DHN2_9HEMI